MTRFHKRFSNLFMTFLCVALIACIIVFASPSTDYYSEEGDPDEDTYYFEKDYQLELCEDLGLIAGENCFCNWVPTFNEEGRVIGYEPKCRGTPWYKPTASPTTTTPFPTPQPTKAPTTSPTEIPSMSPTETPTMDPTEPPTMIDEMVCKNEAELANIYRNLSYLAVQWGELCDQRYYRACGWRNDKGGKCVRLVHRRMPTSPVIPTH